MKKLLKIVLGLSALLLVSCGSAKPDEHGLYNNMDDAIEVAQKKNQDIIVAVTLDGEDIISSDFINNVLFSEDFKNNIANNYAVVHIDFGEATYQKTVVNENDSKADQKKAKEFAEIMQDNTILASQLNVRYTPTFFLFTKDEYFIASLNYSTLDTTEDFQKMLNSYQSDIDEFHALVENTTKGTNQEKVAAIDALYEKTGAEQKIFLYELIEDLLKMDKNNEYGYLSKYLLVKADIDAILLYNEGDVDAASAEYIKVCDNKYLDSEQKQQAYYMAAYLLSIGGSNDFQKVAQYLKLSIDADPESNAVSHIQTVLSSIEAIVQNGLEQTINGAE